MTIKDNEEVQTKRKSGNGKYVSSDSNIDEDDVDQLEALLARRFHRGKGKFKGKLPIIFFNCNEVGHIAARCTQKKNYKDGRKFKNKREDGNKDYKDKGKRCYIVEEDSDDNDDEVVYVAMKDEATTLVTYMNKNYKWIIDSGCSHHMTAYKSKFITFTQYDGNSFRFGNNAPCLIKGKDSIRLTKNDIM